MKRRSKNRWPVRFALAVVLIIALWPTCCFLRPRVMVWWGKSRIVVGVARLRDDRLPWSPPQSWPARIASALSRDVVSMMYLLPRADRPAIPFYVTAWRMPEEPIYVAQDSLLGYRYVRPPTIALQERVNVEYLLSLDYGDIAVHSPPLPSIRCPVYFHGLELTWEDGTTEFLSRTVGSGSTGQPCYWARIPLWMPVGVLAMLLGLRFGFVYWRRRKFRPGGCEKCGYDLRASPQRCPECGQAVLADGVKAQDSLPLPERLRRLPVKMALRLRRDVLWIGAAIILFAMLLRPFASDIPEVELLGDPRTFVSDVESTYRLEYEPGEERRYGVLYYVPDLCAAASDRNYRGISSPDGSNGALDSLRYLSDRLQSFDDGGSPSYYVPPFIFKYATLEGHRRFVKNLNSLRSMVQ